MNGVDHLRREAFKRDGWRFCHAVIARKHRKQGHEVVFFGNGEYAWRPA